MHLQAHHQPHFIRPAARRADRAACAGHPVGAAGTSAAARTAAGEREHNSSLVLAAQQRGIPLPSAPLPSARRPPYPRRNSRRCVMCQAVASEAVVRAAPLPRRTSRKQRHSRRRSAPRCSSCARASRCDPHHHLQSPSGDFLRPAPAPFQLARLVRCDRTPSHPVPVGRRTSAHKRHSRPRSTPSRVGGGETITRPLQTRQCTCDSTSKEVVSHTTSPSLLTPSPSGPTPSSVVPRHVHSHRTLPPYTAIATPSSSRAHPVTLDLAPPTPHARVPASPPRPLASPQSPPLPVPSP